MFNFNAGVPVTVTASLIFTVTLTTSPAFKVLLCAPVALVMATELTVGGTAVISACSSARVSTAEPSSALTAIDVKTSCKLASVTPEIPSNSNCATVGEAAPAAALITRPAASANACNLDKEFTSAKTLASRTSPSKLSFAKLSTPVTPRALYSCWVRFVT